MPTNRKRSINRSGKRNRGSAPALNQVSSLDRNIFNTALRPSASGSAEVITRVLTKEATIQSSGGGTIASIATWDASTFGDFATLAPLYDEWRPLGMEVTIQCQQPYSPAATALSRIVVLVFDNDDAATALTSYQNALDYTVQRRFASVWGNEKLISMRANALNVADPSTGVAWQTTATTSVNKSFKYYSTGLTATTNYLEATYRYVIQLRQPT